MEILENFIKLVNTILNLKIGVFSIYNIVVTVLVFLIIFEIIKIIFFNKGE